MDRKDLEKEWERLKEETQRIEAGRIRLEAEMERFTGELASILDSFEREYGTRDLDKVEEILAQREARAEEVLAAWGRDIERAKSIGRETQAKLAELK